MKYFYCILQNIIFGILYHCCHYIYIYEIFLNPFFLTFLLNSSKSSFHVCIYSFSSKCSGSSLWTYITFSIVLLPREVYPNYTIHLQQQRNENKRKILFYIICEKGNGLELCYMKKKRLRILCPELCLFFFCCCYFGCFFFN